MIKVITWNVNSIKIRLEQIKNLIRSFDPDILLLQEIKCENKEFPFDQFLNYHLAVNGEKGYNGVAIISKLPFDVIKFNVPTFVEDKQSRYIEVLIKDPLFNNIVIGNVYVPNGGEIYGKQYNYKLLFLEKFYQYLKSRINSKEEFIIIGGDFNVAPNELDVYDEIGVEDKTLFSIKERFLFQSIYNLGYYDAIRVSFPETLDLFTWWDYRGSKFKLNQGLRIDHFLLSPLATDNLTDSGILIKERRIKGSSDHAPVWCKISKRNNNIWNFL